MAGGWGLKASVACSDNLSMIPETQWVEEGKNRLLQFVL